jgi:hypothetical protein
MPRCVRVFNLHGPFLQYQHVARRQAYFDEAHLGFV